MRAKELKSLASKSTLIPLLSTLIVTPGLNTEAQTVGKFTFFVMAVMFLSLILGFRHSWKLERLWGGLAFGIIIFATLGVVAQKNSVSEQIFGVYGRNNGLLLLIASMVFFMVVLSMRIRDLYTLLLKRLAQSNWLVMSYFYIQYLGWDPIPWNQLFPSPTSTLGNPNFLSSFLAFSLFAHVAIFSEGKRELKSKIITLSSIILGCIAIFLIGSLQGIILLCIGLLMLFGKLFYENKKLIYLKIITAGSSLIVSLTILGLFKLGPFQFIFRESALAVRREYWLAGLSMFLDSPIFGNGMDSFLYNFDAHKSDNFVATYGTLSSSSAHNVYIDYLQGSGIIMFLLYSILNVLIAIVSIRHIKGGHASEAYWALFIIWVLIQAQSLISIQNISINSWQWMISALLVSRCDFESQLLETKRFDIIDPNRMNALRRTLISAIALIVLMLTPLALIQDTRLAGAIKSSNGNALIRLTTSFPFDSTRFNYTTKALEDGKYWLRALELARASVIENPRNKEGWLAIYSSKISTTPEKLEAEQRIKSLDPFWRP